MRERERERERKRERERERELPFTKELERREQQNKLARVAKINGRNQD